MTAIATCTLSVEEVVGFVAEFTRYPTAKITPRTTLFGDIGIAGDDGDEIMSAFMKRFQVDLSSVRPVHFGLECSPPWAPLMWIYQAWVAYRDKSSTPESRAGLVPITMQDLIDSARARRWIFKYEEAANQPPQPTPLTRRV